MTESSTITRAKDVVKVKDKRQTPFQQGLRLFRQSKLAMVGIIIVGTLIIAAIFAPIIAPHDPISQDLANSLRPPFWQDGGSLNFLLGTDQYGRDIFSRLIYGSRVTLVAAFFAATAGAVFGTALGLLAGFYGGRVDTVIMRLVDIQLGFPLVLLALTIVAVLGASLFNLVLAMAITAWMTYARVVRSSVQTLKHMPFIEATEAAGASNFRIIIRHILPNVLSTILVLITLDIARLALMEAALSFLGLGVPPPTPSWGRMLAEGRDYMIIAYWLVLFPGLAIMLTVLGVNFLGDGLRDALDPTLRGIT